MDLFAPHAIDFYKVGHEEQYNENTTLVYSNLTARSGKNSNVKHSKGIIFVGLQLFLKDYLIDSWNKSFFQLSEDEVVNKFTRRISHALNRKISGGKIRKLHQLGYLPLKIKALPEGSFVPYKVPMMTIFNTLPGFYWLTNYIDCVLNQELWPTINSATTMREYQRVFHMYANETCDNNDFVPYQAHDFSDRGMFGREAAAMSGFAALAVGTHGTDTVHALDIAEEYYNANVELEPVGFSIPATEHSVMCSNINIFEQSSEFFKFRKEFYDRLPRKAYDEINDPNSKINVDKLISEYAYVKRLITEIYPSGNVSIVADSYDFWSFIKYILPALKAEILLRDGKVVVRPDCYDENTQILTQNGWKYFKYLTDDDKVAQVLSDNTHEFVKPEKIIIQDYCGEMIKFKDRHGKIDLLVTPNHRMVVKKKSKEHIIYAENLKKMHYYDYFYRSASAQNKKLKLTNLERLKIAFQADGSYCTGMTSSIRFSFSKQRKIDRLKNILEEENLIYKIYNLTDGRSEFNIKIEPGSILKDFSWVDITKLDKNWCVEFLEELSHWDSSIRTKNRFKYDTTNKECIDIVEYIAIAAGYGIYISKKEDNRKEIFSDVYTAYIMKNNLAGGQSIKISSEFYNGKVYCVKVPSGKIIVKRNKSIMVSGNSGDPVKIITGTLLDKYHYPKSVDEYNNIEEIIPDIISDMEEREIADIKTLDENDLFYVLVLYRNKAYKMYFKITYITNNFDYENWQNDIDRIGDCEFDHIEEYYPTVEEMGLVESLYKIFGGTINSKGYKELNPKIGAIYGDSITLERQNDILGRLKIKGFSSNNIVLGVGSYTFQYTTRDTHGIAMKATYCEVVENGKTIGIPIYKDPKTDDGTKKSARGLLMIERSGDKYSLRDNCNWKEEARGCLETVFHDGKLLIETSLKDIRNRVKKDLDAELENI